MDDLLRRNVRHEMASGRLLDTNGQVLAQSAAPPAWPALAVTATVYDSGTAVATISAERSLRALLLETGVAALLGLGLGAAIFGTARTLPLRALGRAMGELRAARDDSEKKALALELNNREMAAVSQMLEMLQITHSMEEAGQMIAKCAAAIFAEEAGAIYLFTESRAALEAHAAWGPGEQVVTFLPEECWAVRRGQLHTWGATSGAPKCQHVEAAEGYLCLPLMAQGQMLGIIHLQTLGAGALEAWVEKRRQPVLRFAHQLGLAISNLKLRESLKSLSIRDPLTGLYNRRYMEETLEREFRRAQRAKSAVAVIMLDVDHFKRLNDTFGHDAGDAVLRELGVFLKRSIRGSDVACRYGGEEFCLILPDADREGARKKAEALRQGVAQLEIKTDGRVITATSASFGVAFYPDHGDTARPVILAADAALYRAKQEGRDRVCVSPGGLSVG